MYAPKPWPDTGCIQFPPTERSRAWAKAAFECAAEIAQDPSARAHHLRHLGTWFVGVDALPSAADGSVAQVPLCGPWEDYIPRIRPLHPAQVSIIYPGYPQRDADQSPGNHAYRIKRAAAHMDGLLPEGRERSRFAREFHAYILGIHLNSCPAAPTVFWPGSHKVLQNAFHKIGVKSIRHSDVTELYHAARKKIFETVEPVEITGAAGGSFLLHPFALHGTAPWSGPEEHEGRFTAFFRPEFSTVEEWLNA